MTRRGSTERGSAAIELAVFLPVFILLVLAAFSATELFWNHRHLDDVTEAAARFATAAPDEFRGPRPAGTQPTPEAVSAFVGEISELPVLDVQVSPNPLHVGPGQEVTVAVTLEHEVGPIAGIVNALNELIGNDPVFPGGVMQLDSTVSKIKG